MEKNENKKIIDFYNLKQQKIFELQKKKDKSKSVSERKEKVDRNFKELVVHTKESEKKKMDKSFFVCSIYCNVADHSFPVF